VRGPLLPLESNRENELVLTQWSWIYLSRHWTFLSWVKS